MRRAAPLLGTAAIIALAVVALVPQGTPAQFRVQVGPAGRFFGADSAEALPGHPLFVTDREMAQRLRQTEPLLEEGEYGPAVRRLQSILDQPEDSFFQPDRENDAEWRSLKLRAEQLLTALPSEGRDAYENEFGYAAREMLADAVKAGRLTDVQQVARRYFHTEAGREATHRLGTSHFDRGEWLPAAMHFERLRSSPAAPSSRAAEEPLLSLRTAVCWGRAGLPDQAVRTLMDLKQQTPAGQITLGGRQFPLFDGEDEALAWLAGTLGTQQEFAALDEEGWTMFRGNAARNAVSPEVSPLWQEQWRTTTVHRADGRRGDQLDRAAARLRDLETRFREDDVAVIPAMHPLVLGDTVVYRTMQNVRAVSLKTGEFLWETVVEDDAYRQMLETDEKGQEPQFGNPSESPREMFLAQRAWRDLTAGTLSSDGQRLYSLEELGFLGYPSHHSRGVQHPLAPREFNKLTAFGLAGQLKLQWEAGGPPESGLPLAGTYFLGPPLPLAGRLYCLGEGGMGVDQAGKPQDRGGEVRLMVLDPETGALLWEQALLYPQESLRRYLPRRMAGLSPAFAEGVMVCPAAAGAVVAVDLPRRALLWGYRYATNLPDSAKARAAQMRFQMQGRWGTGIAEEERWIDSVPTIAGGRVILTPCDSNDLHCIGLKDGSVRWKKPRGQGLYAACVHDGKVIVVGRNQVEAWNLADGSPAWPQMLAIPLPSGRGIRSGDAYHLPLSTGEIATIDLRTGRMLARSKSPDGQVPGNLVAAAGRIVSQTADALFALEPLDAVEQRISESLADDPDAADALALRGELRLHRGQTDEGLADLRRAAADGDHPRARELIVGSLMEGLRLDFAKYRGAADEIDRLLTDPLKRAEFVRLRAVGLHATGEPVAAFREYVKLVGTGDERASLAVINGSLGVRDDRWVQPRIADVYRTAAPDDRRTMDRLARAQWNDALAQDDARAVRAFLDCFAALPLAVEARRALVERLDPAKDALELEIELGRLRQADERFGNPVSEGNRVSANAGEALAPSPPAPLPRKAGGEGSQEIVAEATARLARLLIERGVPRDAAPLVEELAGRWADTACLDGQTGRQLAEQWRADEKIAAALQPVPSWPARRIEVTREAQAGNIDRMYAVELLGRQGPYYEGWNFTIDARRQHVVATDGYGAERWKLVMGRTGRSFYQSTCNVAYVQGHLVVFDFGNLFAVVDPLSRPDEPAVLWTQDLYDESAITGMNTGLNAHWAIGPGGIRRRVVNDVYNRPLGTLGPITPDALLYRIGSELTACDPLTGDVLWRRRNVPRECEVFGDEELVFVVAPESTQATVLRTSDGEAVATRPVPPADERLTTDGRHVLSWRTADGEGQLTCTDAWTGQAVWQRPFAGESLLQIVKGDELAVLEPAGRFTVLDLTDGQVRVESEIDRIDGLAAFLVRRSRAHYVLLVQSTDNTTAVQALGTLPVLFNGPVYGFDRETGRKLWATDIGRQGLDKTQPEELPVLAFASRVFQFGPGIPQQQFQSNQYTLQVLDTRTGTMIYQPEDDQRTPTAPFDLRGDPATGEIELRFGQAMLHMKPTDEPLAEPGAAPQPDAPDNP